LARGTCALILAAAGVLAAGCGSLLGIEAFTGVQPDASADSSMSAESGADGPGPDVPRGDDTGSADDTSMEASAMDAPSTDAPGRDGPRDDSGDACIPESNDAACGANECNSVENNCGQTVNCGVGGSTSCGAGQACLANDTCCVLATCGNRCNTTIADHCGGTTACPPLCSTGEVCNEMTKTCCTRDGGCSGPCLDNCDQSDPSCCDAGM
jgi:hypothetical protein